MILDLWRVNSLTFKKESKHSKNILKNSSKVGQWFNYTSIIIAINNCISTLLAILQTK